MKHQTLNKMTKLAAVLAIAALNASAEERRQSQTRIVVSIPDRKLVLFDGDRVVKIYDVAVGKSTTPTPERVFRIALWSCGASTESLNQAGSSCDRGPQVLVPSGDYRRVRLQVARGSTRHALIAGRCSRLLPGPMWIWAAVAFPATADVKA
jgi:hypothetical protein